ncbi:MAG: ATP-binding cassette domain-containing protein, partial [Myxococcales bacterium]|nr:ATP-binding cassette domain-containing protein [Myxococcales bacterium]
MNQTKTPLVELQGISRIYETDDVETHALSDVALRIDEGEFVSIEGPSGSGKTTLLSILGLLDVPTAGRY